MAEAIVRLSALEAQAMTAWQSAYRDFGFLSFSTIERRSTLPSHLVRRVTRALARKGLVTYARGLFTDMGEVAGSGYGLTELGRQYLNRKTEANAPVQGKANHG